MLEIFVNSQSLEVSKIREKNNEKFEKFWSSIIIDDQNFSKFLLFFPLIFDTIDDQNFSKFLLLFFSLIFETSSDWLI